MADNPLLATNPIVGQLANAPAGQASSTALATFSGWVGTCKRPNTTRLHLNINDLSQFLEFDTDAVVHTAPIAEEVMPGKAVCLWLRGNAKVRVIRAVNSTASAVSQAFNSNWSDAVQGSQDDGSS